MSLFTRISIAAVLMLLAGNADAVYTVDGERKSFEIFRTTLPPVIDGRLDDEVWKSAAIVDDFHQTAPADGANPTETTIVRVTYDDEFLYIAAHLKDSDPNGILAKQMIQGKMFY